MIGRAQKSVRGGEDANNRAAWRRQLGAFVAAVGLGSVAAACGAAEGQSGAAGLNDEPAAPTTRHVRVRPGIDVWIDRDLAPLRGRRVGLITNTTGRSADGSLTLDLLAASPDIELVAVFTPEHAFAASLEGDVEHAVHAATGLPLYSLYGDTRRPTPEMLDGVEGLVFDIQDVGTRFYTYASTMVYAMEEAAAHGLPFVVLDRPNPIGGVHVSGAVKATEIDHFIATTPVPVRHGMTIGELARMMVDERAPGLDLTVIPMEGWRRDLWFDQTGLLWVDPSPNLRNVTQATLYPAVGPLEWTSLSVGRGTDAPFEWLGAPWIESRTWARELNALGLPGVSFVPRRLSPASGPWTGELCGGVNLLLLDRDAFDAGRTAVALATTLAALYPDQWERDRLPVHWGEEAILRQLSEGWSLERIVASWEPELERFRTKRQGYLLYE